VIKRACLDLVTRRCTGVRRLSVLNTPPGAHVVIVAHMNIDRRLLKFYLPTVCRTYVAKALSLSLSLSVCVCVCVGVSVCVSLCPRQSPFDSDVVQMCPRFLHPPGGFGVGLLNDVSQSLPRPTLVATNFEPKLAITRLV